MLKKVLNKDFYLKQDVVKIAKNLLGKFLFTNINNILTGGMIVETESYKAIDDKASHAYMGKRTKRNEAMYLKGGIAYVYICYGIHSLFNVVTNKKDMPDAVLIRAIEPIEGLDAILKRRGKKNLNPKLTSGPGALCMALNITKALNGASLNSKIIWIEDRNIQIQEKDILCSKRVGVDYAKEDALLPWRFRIKNNKWTSIAK